MGRSLSYLRRGLLGIAFIGSFGFGVNQAFGSSERAVVGGPACPAKISDYAYAPCASWCRSKGLTGGYCNTGGICACGALP